MSRPNITSLPTSPVDLIPTPIKLHALELQNTVYIPLAAVFSLLTLGIYFNNGDVSQVAGEGRRRAGGVGGRNFLIERFPILIII
jgi:hypothetical protein